MSTSISKPENPKTLVKGPISPIEIDNIHFSFKEINKNSIVIKGFNNKYKTKKIGVFSFVELVDAMKEISSIPYREISSPAWKRKFHFHKIKDDQEIDRIENVLLNGYSLPQMKVDSYEKDYYQFCYGRSGERAIGYLALGIFTFLFLDPNHLVYKESSRNLKEKLMYGCKGILDFDRETGIFENECERIEYVKMLVEDSEKGNYEKIDTFARDIKSVIYD